MRRLQSRLIEFEFHLMRGFEGRQDGKVFRATGGSLLAVEPGGFSAIRRWLSEAIPPVVVRRRDRIPEG